MILYVLLAFGSIQAEGSSPLAVGGSILIGLVMSFYFMGQKISYLQVGNRIVVETRADENSPQTQDNDPQEQNR